MENIRKEDPQQEPPQTPKFPKPDITPEKIKATEEFQQHRKESWWQIYFPMLIVFALLILVIVLMVLGTIKPGPNATHSKWADLLVMITIAIVSVVTLIITAVLGVSIYYLGIGIKKTPEVSNQAKFYVNHAAKKIHEAMEAITKPIIKAGGAARGVQTAVRNLRKKPTD